MNVQYTAILYYSSQIFFCLKQQLVIHLTENEVKLNLTFPIIFFSVIIQSTNNNIHVQVSLKHVFCFGNISFLAQLNEECQHIRDRSAEVSVFQVPFKEHEIVMLLQYDLHNKLCRPYLWSWSSEQRLSSQRESKHKHPIIWSDMQAKCCFPSV